MDAKSASSDKSLSYSIIYIGTLRGGATPSELTTSSSSSSSSSKNNASASAGLFRSGSLAPFDGQMQQLIINGKSQFELIENDESTPHGGTAHTDASVFSRTRDHLVVHRFALTFHTQHAHMRLPKIVDTAGMLLIQFHLKTSESHGLVLFNRARHRGYLAIEIVDGQLACVVAFAMPAPNTNGAGSRRQQQQQQQQFLVIKTRLRRRLNDNKWHYVSFRRATRADYELHVDSIVYRNSTRGSVAELAFVDQLHVGGVEDIELVIVHHDSASGDSAPRVHSKDGFRGCIASLEINGQAPEFERALGSVDKVRGNVSKGCESKCSIKYR